MEERMDMLSERCEKEGQRLLEARYYGSAALKDILENSDEFSDLVEPDEDVAEPEEDNTPAQPETFFLPTLKTSSRRIDRKKMPIQEKPWRTTALSRFHFKLAGTVKTGLLWAACKS